MAPVPKFMTLGKVLSIYHIGLLRGLSKLLLIHVMRLSYRQWSLTVSCYFLLITPTLLIRNNGSQRFKAMFEAVQLESGRNEIRVHVL